MGEEKDPNTKIIDGILVNEGGATVTNNPNDAGGRTQYGISEKDNPAAWADGVVTEEEAREIYLKKYLVSPGFDKIESIQLRTQLVDYGVNSGPAVAIMKLQGILGVAVDGVLGPDTLAALEKLDSGRVNNLLAAARIKMIGKIVTKNPTQLQFLNGWLNRATEFIF
jgi:lysozyme family protein